ncbi:MAG TPA: hypothetical protein DCY03_30515 [Planctomycetaceae bacterium]|nr:hypothetical protein [Planctomycetaceae bacterium]
MNVGSLRQADRADDYFPEGVQERYSKWICFFHIKRCAYRIVNMVLNSLKVAWISRVNPEKQFAIAGCDVIS